MSATDETLLGKLAALATAPSATPNERDVARRKFDAAVAIRGLSVTVEGFLSGHLQPVTHIKVSARGARVPRFEGKTLNVISLGLAYAWDPARFRRAPCPHGCGALVYLVPKSGTKRTFVSVTDGRIERTEDWFGNLGDVVVLDYHDDACPEIARQEREATEERRKLAEERRAAAETADAAREAAIAADPTIRTRELAQRRAARRSFEAFQRHEREANGRAKAAANAAKAAYWREVKAKAERTRRWREANPDRSRQLNREAQARWRARQKLAKAATAIAVRDRP